MSFNAVAGVGDGEGQIGVGLGKANAVPDAVRKGTAAAKKNMVTVAVKDNTIPHEVLAKYCGSIVMLKPASPGTGVIAGATVRAVVELAGIKDILTKVRRSSNPVNVVKATFKGLQSMKDPEYELSKRKELAENAKIKEEQRQNYRRTRARS